MSRVLVTGGNGFIGSHLVDALAASGKHEVLVLGPRPRPYDELPADATFVEGDVRDANLLGCLLADHEIEVVYHAAWSSISETAIRDQTADIETNLVPLVRLLDACRDSQVRRVLFLSTGGAVYGLPRTNPVTEEHPTHPISPYGITKLAAEKYVRMYREHCGLEYVILRPSVPYGPRQDPNRRQGAVTVFTHRALQGEPITIWGEGESLRDYFYVGDMIAPLINAMEIPFAGDMTFNLAGTRGYTLLELVSVLEDVLNVRVRVEHRERRVFDVPRLELDSSAAAEFLGWSDRTSLADGIRRTADWLERVMKKGCRGSAI
jgi:UDP-glucose 4-epimerase